MDKSSKSCEVCGDTFATKPSQYESRHTCSQRCNQERKRRRREAELLIELTCPVCHRPYKADKTRLRHGRETTCSRECSYHFRPAKARARRVRLTRVGCGTKFERSPSHLLQRRGGGRYCSRPCRDKHRVKELHPQFITGRASEKRGPNWQRQRRRALKRDRYTCQSCGQPGESVHHMLPYRWFNDDFRRANQLANLITYCGACHRRADALLHAAEREGASIQPPMPLWPHSPIQTDILLQHGIIRPTRAVRNGPGWPRRPPRQCR
jgi:5-methylcytosine-specific restriction endonuclease McrA